MPDRKPRDAKATSRARKSVRVDDDLIRRARKILRTQTASETVTAALDLIIFRNEVTRGIRRMAGSNSLRDIYEDEG
jgi:Arc/MetJ family transcription regulator